jgi:lysophospholipid acyltransferase (LPLAT)-like uncharacterized protein
VESFKKRFFNRLKALDIVQWMMAAVLWLGIRMVYLTSRKEIRGDYIFREFRGKPAIFVFWHGRSMMLSPIVRRFCLRGYAIASKHMDGRMMAKLQRMFGLRPIYGSSARGAVNVLRQGVRVLQKNRILCLSPDGPKGPRMRLNDGCLYFAKMSGAPVIPVCFTTSRPWVQHRWDRYLVAKMFGRIICTVGAPIYYNRNNPREMDDLHIKLESLMVSQMQSLDREIGWSEAIEPELASK